jgi:hypothetical protein
MAASGYSKKFAYECLDEGERRWRGIVRKYQEGKRPLFRNDKDRAKEKAEKAEKLKLQGVDSKGKVRCFIDHCDDDLARELNSAAKQYGLDMTVDSRGGNMLKHIYKPRGEQRNANPPRGCVEEHDSKFWLTTGSVYKIVCARCPEGVTHTYIGESCRPLQDRVKEHVRCVRTQSDSSALTMHYQECHPDPAYPDSACLPLSFKISLLEKNLPYTKRKIREAIHIKKHDPDLNRRYEEDKCQSLLYLDLDESERAAIRQQRGQQ